MIARRWGAARAGAAGYLCALALSIIAFGAGPRLLAYAHAKALLLALDVLLIIWAAFLFYRVCDEAGAIRIIAQALPNLTADRGMQAILIGWVFASFLQGIGGFGVPVAVTAPILAGLGLTPLAAVLIPSIGHGWSVNFGSLGSSFQALLNATGMTAAQLAPSAAVFLGFACLVSGPMVAHAAGGWPAVRRLLLPALLIGFVMAGTQYLVAVYGSWNIAAFSASIAGLFVSIPLAYLFRDKKPQQTSINRNMLLLAFSGYVLVIVIILAAQFVSPLKSFLGQITIQISFPETITGLGFVTPAGYGRKINLFGHTGALLFYAALLTYFIFHLTHKYKSGAPSRIMVGTLQRVMSSSVSILSMVTMAVIMEQVGMTETLARGMADAMGSLFPMISPWIGALGAFMTGSNTNSNVVFGALQKQTAELLGFSLAIILAAQTTGGSLGSVAAPTKVVVGASTAGMDGHEGEVLRALFGYVTFLIALISLLTVFGILYLQYRGL